MIYLIKKTFKKQSAGGKKLKGPILRKLEEYSKKLKLNKDKI